MTLCHPQVSDFILFYYIIHILLSINHTLNVSHSYIYSLTKLNKTNHRLKAVWMDKDNYGFLGHHLPCICYYKFTTQLYCNPHEIKYYVNFHVESLSHTRNIPKKVHDREVFQITGSFSRLLELLYMSFVRTLSLIGVHHSFVNVYIKGSHTPIAHHPGLIESVCST